MSRTVLLFLAVLGVITYLLDVCLWKALGLGEISLFVAGLLTGFLAFPFISALGCALTSAYFWWIPNKK